MKNKTFILSGLVVMLMVVAVIGATNAYAQGQGPGTPPALGEGRGSGDGGRGDGREPMGGAGMEAAAQALGMTTDELTTALKGGKTLEQIAQEKGVAFADVQAAMQKARNTEMRDRIQQALKDGTITQDHADWLLEGLDKGFLDGTGGFGLGFGGGGPHGPGASPSAQPTQTSGQ